MILNSRRQIVRANERTAGLLGMSRDRLLGLRLGEAIQCPRAHESPRAAGPHQAAGTAVRSEQS